VKPTQAVSEQAGFGNACITDKRASAFVLVMSEVPFGLLLLEVPELRDVRYGWCFPSLCGGQTEWTWLCRYYLQSDRNEKPTSIPFGRLQNRKSPAITSLMP
jgi:hypothetical protein